MSSLVTSASPWTNEISSKKRVSSIRKTIKHKPEPIDEIDSYVSQSENYQNMQPPTIEETQSLHNDRNTRVNDLLNKITAVDSSSSNDDGKMGNFQPLPNPNYQLKKDMDDDTNILGARPSYSMPSYTQASNSLKEMDGKFSSNIDNSRVLYSNYNKSYEPPMLKPYVGYQGNPRGQSNGAQGTHFANSDSKLMEKINYMIHLLEQQQMEKTSNITEEFILYSFLGIFMIFIVDSFSRSGKYTR
jgi:hypothetical protein